MKYVVIFFCIVEKSFGISKVWFDDYDSARNFVDENKYMDRCVNCENDFIYKIVPFPELTKYV